jgi:hypothetical protein
MPTRHLRIALPRQETESESKKGAAQGGPEMAMRVRVRT